MISGSITKERLRELLNYDDQSGLFTWRVRRGGRALVGSVAGSKGSGGYVQIYVESKFYLAHRLAWLWVHGAMPSEEIDHIDGDRKNNAINNLRQATPGQNQQNRKPISNRCGLVGASVGKKGKFRARINMGNRSFHLGTFETAEEASAAYLSAKEALHSFQPTQRGAQPIPYEVTPEGRAIAAAYKKRQGAK